MPLTPHNIICLPVYSVAEGNAGKGVVNPRIFLGKSVNGSVAQLLSPTHRFSRKGCAVC